MTTPATIMAAANNLMVEALKRKPEDPNIRMSYVLQCFHVVSIERAQLQAICQKGSLAEPENAAYIYLEALSLLESSNDLEALGRITEGLSKPFVSFHDVGRAETTAAFLREAGLGTVGARLASYRAANVDGPMKMRRLAQSLRNLPLAMEGNPAPAILFPRRLSQQIAKKPRLLRTEHIRLELLLGSWAWSIGESPDSPAALEARKELDALKAGRRLASGPEAWDEFFSRLGEEGFRKYLDEVLFGHEAEFLKKCSTEVSIEDCARMLK